MKAGRAFNANKNLFLDKPITYHINSKIVKPLKFYRRVCMLVTSIHFSGFNITFENNKDKIAIFDNDIDFSNKIILSYDLCDTKFSVINPNKISNYKILNR